MTGYSIGDIISVSDPGHPEWPPYVYKVAGIAGHGGLYCKTPNGIRMIPVDDPTQVIEVIDQERQRVIERARR
jgi:hypothetical protein